MQDTDSYNKQIWSNMSFIQGCFLSSVMAKMFIFIYIYLTLIASIYLKLRAPCALFFLRVVTCSLLSVVLLMTRLLAPTLGLSASLSVQCDWPLLFLCAGSRVTGAECCWVLLRVWAPGTCSDIPPMVSTEAAICRMEEATCVWLPCAQHLRGFRRGKWKVAMVHLAPVTTCCNFSLGSQRKGLPQHPSLPGPKNSFLSYLCGSRIKFKSQSWFRFLAHMPQANIYVRVH